MDEAKIRLVKSWLTKAHRDLGSSKALMDQTPPYLDTAIYHCQQAAEKALKAFLTFHNILFDKTHNLSSLLDLCEQVDSDFQNYYEAAATLTPYATAFRYPSEFFEEEPDEEQVREALKFSEQILNFVLDRLPQGTRPDQ